MVAKAAEGALRTEPSIEHPCELRSGYVQLSTRLPPRAKHISRHVRAQVSNPSVSKPCRGLGLGLGLGLALQGALGDTYM